MEDNTISLITGWTVYTEKCKARGLYEGPRDLYFSYRQSSQLLYLLTNWLAYLYRRIQNRRPDIMRDRREGITRAAGFGFACIEIRKPVSKKFIA